MIDGIRIVDAHMHLLPERLINQADPLTGAVLDGEGRIHRIDGVVMNALPPFMKKAYFSCENLIQLMQDTGIDKAVIMQSSFFNLSEDAAQAVQRHPDQLIGAMTVPPVIESIADIEKWHRMGLRAIKFEMRGLMESGRYPDLKPNNPAMLQILAEAGRHNVTAVFDPGPMGWGCCRADDLREAVRRCPETRFVICHLGQPSARVLEDRALYSEWENMISLADHPNVWFDVSAMPNLFPDEGYPFSTAATFMKAFQDAYGEEKLIWGSDAPGVLKNASYVQTFEMFRQWDVFSDRGLERLFGLNALDAYL